MKQYFDRSDKSGSLEWCYRRKKSLLLQVGIAIGVITPKIILNGQLNGTTHIKGARVADLTKKRNSEGQQWYFVERKKSWIGIKEVVSM